MSVLFTKGEMFDKIPCFQRYLRCKTDLQKLQKIAQAQLVNLSIFKQTRHKNFQIKHRLETKLFVQALQDCTMYTCTAQKLSNICFVYIIQYKHCTQTRQKLAELVNKKHECAHHAHRAHRFLHLIWTQVYFALKCIFHSSVFCFTQEKCRQSQSVESNKSGRMVKTQCMSQSGSFLWPPHAKKGLKKWAQYTYITTRHIGII